MLSILILFMRALLVLAETEKITEDLLNLYKPLDSFVVLKGGNFHMGINDPEGLNNEFPMRFSYVKPFRYDVYFYKAFVFTVK